MQISVENVSSLGRKLTVTIPANEIDQKTNDKINEARKTMKVDGFRPGKVPFSMIMKKHGDAFRQQVIYDIIEKTYLEALKSEDLKPAEYPKIDPEKSEFGKDLVYTATFEVLPEIDLKTLDGVEIERKTCEVTDKDVNKAIDTVRKQHVEFVDVDRKSKDGDRLVIDFSGTIDGVKFEGGEAKDFKFELGAGSMLSDFEKPLYAVSKDEKLSFEVNFPKDYGDESVSGKTSVFEVVVKNVQEAKLPELNDEFLKLVNFKDGSVDDYIKKTKESLTAQIKQKVESDLKDNLLKKLVELNPIEIPSSMVEKEIDKIIDQRVQQISMYTGKNIKDIARPPRDNFIKEAREGVHLGLLMEVFIKEKKIKPDVTKVRAKIEEMTKDYPNSEEMVSLYFSNKKYLERIEAIVLEDESIEKLKENVLFKDVKTTVDKL